VTLLPSVARTLITYFPGTGGGSERCWAGSHCHRCRRDRERGWSSLHRNRSYQRLGEEEYWKNRAQNGAIPAVPVRMADRQERSDEESFHNVVNRRDGRTMVSFSRSKRRFVLKEVS
jgi:hypothetical protein